MTNTQLPITVEDENKLFLLNSSLSKKVNNEKRKNDQETFERVYSSHNISDFKIYQRKLGHPELLINWNSNFLNRINENFDKVYHRNAFEFWVKGISEKDCFFCNKSNLTTLFYRRNFTD